MTTITRTSSAAVSRVLGAEFRKSKISKTRISGWYNTHAGFVVEKFGDEVLVTYELGNWAKGTRDEAARLTESLVSQYASYLSGKGYEVSLSPNSVRVHGRA